MAKIPTSRLNSAPEKYEKNEFDQLIEEMINYDLKSAQNEKLIKNNTNL